MATPRLIHYKNSQLDTLFGKGDGIVFFGPWDCYFSGGTWTMTRNASGNYSMNKTAAADTTYINADITDLISRSTVGVAAVGDDGSTITTGVANSAKGSMTGPGGQGLPTTVPGLIGAAATIGKGLALTSMDVMYSITTADVTSITPVLQTVTFVSGSAAAVASAGAFTPTTLTPTQTTNIRTASATVPAVWFNTVDQKVNLEIALVAATTSVFKFYGIMFYFTHNFI